MRAADASRMCARVLRRIVPADKIIQEHKKAKEDYKRFRADLEAAQQTKNEVDDELDSALRALRTPVARQANRPRPRTRTRGW